jgi:hypothetical protein
MGLFDEPILVDVKRPKDLKYLELHTLFKPWNCKMSDEEWEEHCLEMERKERLRRSEACLAEEFLDAGI